MLIYGGSVLIQCYVIAMVYLIVFFSAGAGVGATLVHDAIMVPADGGCTLYFLYFFPLFLKLSFATMESYFELVTKILFTFSFKIHCILYSLLY